MVHAAGEQVIMEGIAAAATVVSQRPSGGIASLAGICERGACRKESRSQCMRMRTAMVRRNGKGQ